MKVLRGLQGQVSIFCPPGQGADYIAIQLEDDKSVCLVTEIRIKYADFAQAVAGGPGYVDCEFDLYVGNVGKRREIKEERICVPRVGFEQNEAVAAEAVAVYNVDGWTGRVRDALNQHRHVQSTDDGTWYRVSYVRWVDDDPAPQP